MRSTVVEKHQMSDKPVFKMSAGQWVCIWKDFVGWGDSVELAFSCLLETCLRFRAEPPRGRIDWKPGWFV